MPTCKSDLDCLQDIDDHILRIDDKVRDLFTSISVRPEITNYILIPILILLLIIVVCVSLLVYIISRREKVRFVNSHLTDLESVQALVP